MTIVYFEKFFKKFLAALWENCRDSERLFFFGGLGAHEEFGAGTTTEGTK